MEKTMTVRAINALTQRGKPIVARYVLDGQEQQGRVIRARSRAGQLEGKLLGSGRWVAITAIWEAR
jgi:hypothetical protein